MNATDDENYMRWWNSHGDMAEPEIEYRAWKAGRAFEKSRPTKLAPDSLKAAVNSLPKSPKTGKPLLAKSG